MATGLRARRTSRTARTSRRSDRQKASLHQTRGGSQEGARPITLDVLSVQESRALLTRHLGADRIDADVDAVTELIDQCARLPLALTIVAARATTHPSFTLRVLATELADAHTRLAGLDTGEATTSVRAVFSWSYHHLTAAAARMFRLFGLHPGPDIALLAAARLADLGAAQARETLGELVRAHLLTQHTHDRYLCHDLLRAYAVNLAATHDPQDDQSGALIRLLTTICSTERGSAADLLDDPDLAPNRRAGRDRRQRGRR